MVNLLLNFEAINHKTTRAWVKSNVMDSKLSYAFHGIRFILTKKCIPVLCLPTHTLYSESNSAEEKRAQ